LHISYEYILSGLVVLLVLTSTEITMYALMSQRLASLKQESGYTTADKILDVLLLSPGDPSDWGKNVSETPVSLGLADQNAMRAYFLDPNKVERLHNDSTGYISPSEARDLLGLRRSYQFSLRIKPVLSIEISSVEVGGNETFTLTVRDTKGFPVPNVNITAYYVPESLGPGADYPHESNMTRIDGTCTVTFTSEPELEVLVVQAEQLGVRVVATHPSSFNFVVEGGRVFESGTLLVTDFPPYSTGLVSGLDKDLVSRYVEIGGLTYVVEFELWG